MTTVDVFAEVDEVEGQRRKAKALRRALKQARAELAEARNVLIRLERECNEPDDSGHCGICTTLTAYWWGREKP